MLDVLRDLTPLNRLPCASGYEVAIERARAELPFTVLDYPPDDVHNGWVIPPKSDVIRATIEKDGRLIWDGLSHPLAVIAYSSPFRGKVGPGGIEAAPSFRRALRRRSAVSLPADVPGLGARLGILRSEATVRIAGPGNLRRHHRNTGVRVTASDAGICPRGKARYDNRHRGQFRPPGRRQRWCRRLRRRHGALSQADRPADKIHVRARPGARHHRFGVLPCPHACGEAGESARGRVS